MKSERAVTMIVLVVTIIVLLIIAGITISYVIGEDGTISQASNASFEAELDQIIELINEKQDTFNLEEERTTHLLSDSDKQSILSDRYNVEDENKKVMDIEVEYENAEIKLILTYKKSAFNDKQIEILNKTPMNMPNAQGKARRSSSLHKELYAVE